MSLAAATPDAILSSRQEAFCHHYAASGNAADAARRAGSDPLSPPAMTKHDIP